MSLPSPKLSDFPALTAAVDVLREAGLVWSIHVDRNYVWIAAVVDGTTRDSRRLLRSHKPNRKQIAAMVEWAQGLARVSSVASQSTAQPSATNRGIPADGSPLPVVIVEDEPRVLDTDLAKAMGMARPTNVRVVIETNRDELTSFGPLHAANAMVGIGSGAKREVTTYHLNEEQALLICLLSRTEKAKQVRAEVIRVFTAWRRGQLAPQAVQAIADARQSDRNALVGAPISYMQRTVVPAIIETRDRVAALDSRMDGMGRWLNARMRAMLRRDATMMRDLRAMVAALAEEQHRRDVVTIHEIKAIVGIDGVVASGALTNRLRNNAICWFSEVEPARSDLRTGKRVWWFARDHVQRWWRESGREIYERHRARQFARPTVVTLDGGR